MVLETLAASCGKPRQAYLELLHMQRYPALISPGSVLKKEDMSVETNAVAWRHMLGVNPNVDHNDQSEVRHGWQSLLSFALNLLTNALVKQRCSRRSNIACKNTSPPDSGGLAPRRESALNH
jgi:hypothetical protein